MSNGRTAGLIVAAGRGERAGGDVPKQYRPICGTAMLAHAYDALAGHPAMDSVTVVIGAGQEDHYAAAMAGRDAPAPVIGGETRRDSVIAGLAAIDADRVLIHDAARPFLPHDVIDRLVAALDVHAGAVPALSVVDSLARGDGLLGDGVDRAQLWRVQTPQAFHLPAIIAAHRAWDAGREATDDAQVARAAGLDVAIVAGDSRLEKVTHDADFAATERRMESNMITVTGSGYDVHRLAEGEELWLGGILIPHDRGLAGHSDADVALHALTDALLATIGAGDIGTHFPPSDAEWRGASSDRFLSHAAGLIAAQGGRIDHVDLTIICEAPRIGPYRDAMRARIGGLLRLPDHRVSIKATTTEKLGFTGRGEGIAAQATASVRIAEDL